MEPQKTEETEPLEAELDLIDELSDCENGVEVESPDVEFCVNTIEKIRQLFDAGSTRSMIAKELGLSRADVIEVLGNYIGRAKINGKHTQEVKFEFDATGKHRISLGDIHNTQVYVKDGEDEAAVRRKWLKILKNNNE